MSKETQQSPDSLHSINAVVSLGDINEGLKEAIKKARKDERAKLIAELEKLRDFHYKKIGATGFSWYDTILNEAIIKLKGME